MSETAQNRTILISGGAQGIGRMTALRCARRGDKIAVLDRERFYSREKRSEFRFWPHLFCSAVSTGLLIWVDAKSVVPLPQGVLRYAPILVGAWIALGVGLLAATTYYKRGVLDFSLAAVGRDNSIGKTLEEKL